ncbi:MAG: MurT ligase domain-containing protein [Candidatus Saccharimonadales bacterium]
MQFLGLSIGKMTLTFLHLFGRTGSALPGLVVEKINPRFLPRMLRQLPNGVIVVSGTNGKTTTTKIISALFEAQGLRVLTNKTGSNFVRGIISVVVSKAGWNGQLPYDIAVFEQDEAHAVHFARQVKPRGVVVLNIMRDQMDRFGEIDTTRQLLGRLTASATDFVVLNVNDERVSQLQTSPGVRPLSFGYSKKLSQDFRTDDQLHEDKVAYFQAARPTTELTAFSDSSLTLKATSEHSYEFSLQGGHNALNVAAALTTVAAVLPDYDESLVAKCLAELEPAFGRGEVIKLPNGTDLTLQLIKNPGAFTQGLKMLELKEYATIGIAINDDYPDGRDVSWLWDVDFSNIGVPVACGGARAADMANRLKYDEVAVSIIEPDLERLAAEFSELAAHNAGEALLFCTYTAMLKLREIYVGSTGGLDEV